jgi:hypothetical protein
VRKEEHGITKEEKTNERQHGITETDLVPR